MPGRAAARPAGFIVIAVAISGLVLLSLWLAWNRIFQVDELEAVFTARLLATHQTSQYAASANLMLLGPMSWIAGASDRSVVILRNERLLFLPLFWINVWLIVHCAGLRLRSLQGLFAFVLAATLAPLWDYGFEIRHETLLLTVTLLAWSFARPLLANAQRRIFPVAFLAVIGQFIAFKSFAYLAPIALFAVYAAWREDKRPILGIALAAAGGALTALVLSLTAHWFAGTWSIFSADTKSIGQAALHTSRFSAQPLLLRFLIETPLLVLATVVALVVAANRARLQSITARESLAPEVWLLLMAFAALFANPTPFPYNMVLLVPQAAILSLRLSPMEWMVPRISVAVLTAAVLVHLLVWALFTKRHLPMTNSRQIKLMTMAEELTDPKVHAVLDGAGLVPTRHPPGHFWLIHTFTIASFRNGTVSVPRQLSEGRTPVVIPSYRLAGLSRDDRRYIWEHYIALAGDFLVAGAPLPAGTREWECLVPGRYALLGSPALIDAQAHQPGVLVLSRGIHRFDVQREPASLVWLGPSAQRLPELEAGDARRLLVNFY
ncbi:MAG: hypothetical protein ACXV5L_04130 [Thermoanaerobaculia bacterium]